MLCQSHSPTYWQKYVIAALQDARSYKMLVKIAYGRCPCPHTWMSFVHLLLVLIRDSKHPVSFLKEFLPMGWLWDINMFLSCITINPTLGPHSPRHKNQKVLNFLVSRIREGMDTRDDQNLGFYTLSGNQLRKFLKRGTLVWYNLVCFISELPGLDSVWISLEWFHCSRTNAEREHIFYFEETRACCQ